MTLQQNYDSIQIRQKLYHNICQKTDGLSKVLGKFSKVN